MRLRLKMAEPEQRLELPSILNALPSAVFVVDRQHQLRFVNSAAEDLLDTGAGSLLGRPLDKWLGKDNRLLELISQVFESGSVIKEYDHPFSVMKSRQQVMANVHITPLIAGDTEIEDVLVMVDPQGMVNKLTSHVSQREVMKTAGLMAAILAHEVKNPLSGIRGAAQLLSSNANADDQKLTTLICDEVDRIKNLLGQIDFFSNQSAFDMEEVNIHEVLQYVKSLAQAGFAAEVEIAEMYDPSLPSVQGNREMLVQLFINLIKNAAEAVSEADTKQIRISTSYRSGYRFSVGDNQVALPISILVQDTGSGVPEELRGSVFDPFVTSKLGGKGLGLAIVAKIVADHGGVIELDDEDMRYTGFRISLPVTKRVSV